MKLPTTTRARLAKYRKSAAESKWSNDWRKHKYCNTWTPAWHGWDGSRRKIYADARDTLGDYLGDWADLRPWLGREATGFYSDSFCSDVIRGGVERIRGAKFTLYVPVTYCTGWDGVTYYMSAAERVERGENQEAHDNAIGEASGSAYYYAEREAEISRDDDAKQRAAEDIQDAREEIHDINRHARALLAEIRGKEFTDNVCAALRHRLQEYLADRRRCFAKITERTENYWTAVPY